MFRRGLTGIGRQMEELFVGKQNFGQRTLILTILIFALTVSERMRDDATFASDFLFVLWTVVLARLVVGFVASRGRRSPRFWKSVTIAILLFIFVRPTDYWDRHCTHGDAWMLGRVGIACSSQGRPCPIKLPYRIVIPVGGNWYIILSATNPARTQYF